MNNLSEHDELATLLGAYALDAVDPEEALLLEAHLGRCPRCRNELDHYRAVASALGNEVEPLPASLWDQIAERITRDPPPGLRAVPGPFPVTAARDSGPTPRPVSMPDRGAPQQWSRRARQARNLVWPVAVAAVALVIALLGAGLSHSNDQLNQSRQALQTGGLNAAVQGALATPGSHVASLEAPNGQRLAEVVVLPDGQAYLTGSSMAALPSDETYQLWTTIEGQPISLGLLGPQPRQAAFSLATSAHASALMVTVEPAGGVTTPDRAPVASATL